MVVEWLGRAGGCNLCLSILCHDNWSRACRETGETCWLVGLQMTLAGVDDKRDLYHQAVRREKMSSTESLDPRVVMTTICGPQVAGYKE